MLGHAPCHALSFHSQTITHSVTNNGCSSLNKAAQPKQWLLASTYCYGGRSAHPTLLVILEVFLSNFHHIEFCRSHYTFINARKYSQFSVTTFWLKIQAVVHMVPN